MGEVFVRGLEFLGMLGGVVYLAIYFSRRSKRARQPGR
jgi:hypothetical protein